MADIAGDGSVDKAVAFDQEHSELVLNVDWWWAVHICLCAIAVVANLIFIITVIHNRRRTELKTFVTAVITTIAVLDIVDVLRILPVLSPEMFAMEIYRHVYCSLGVFHELAVAIFIVLSALLFVYRLGRRKNYQSSMIQEPHWPTRSLSLLYF